jgi:hypothetical protein
MLIAKLKATFLVVLLAFPVPLGATTIVLIVTPYGMVIGSDSKMFTTNVLGSDSSRVGEGSTKKFVIVQDRIIVASLGHSDIQRGSAHYNFLTWMEKLQTNLPDGISVDDLTSTIQAESAKVFAEITTALQRGIIKRHEPTETCGDFVRYVIAGYQGGAPRIQIVQYYVNWDEERLIGPQVILLDPDKQTVGNFRIHYLGIREALTNVLNRDSYAYKQTMINSPKAFRDLLAHRNVPLNETIALARAFIAVEEKISPDDVGGRIRLVKVLPNGRADEVIDNLPKTTTRQSQQKH